MKLQTYTIPTPFSLTRQRWLSTLALLPVCLYLCARRGEPQVLDLLNLLVHEAGHFCFYFFGDTMHAAGGTLMQVLLPAAIVLHFRQYYSRLGMQIGLLWLGQNCLNISVYVQDARVQELILLPGRKHDWHYLLGQMGGLEYDGFIAYLFCVASLLCFLSLLVMPFYAKG